MSSTFRVDVVPVVLLPHPNADSLSIVKPFGENGYQVVVRTQDWEGVDRGAYIEPDSVVPDRPEYAFLGPREKDRRIRAKRLRQEWSWGLLVPAPKGSEIGDDVSTILEITHWNPLEKGRGAGERIFAGDYARAPRIAGPRYDVENWRKYGAEFEDEELVVITEKIHGTNAGITYQDGEFHVRSRSFYRKGFLEATPTSLKERIQYWVLKSLGNPVLIQNPSLYWDAFRADPDFLQLVQEHTGVIFYCEIYGNVQAGFTYDTDGTNRFRVFDCYSPLIPPTNFASWEAFSQVVPERWRVPVDYVGPYSKEVVERYCTAPSQLTDQHVREGVVVKPVKERFARKAGGRLVLKAVNPAYLEKG